MVIGCFPLPSPGIITRDIHADGFELLKVTFRKEVFEIILEDSKDDFSCAHERFIREHSRPFEFFIQLVGRMVVYMHQTDIILLAEFFQIRSTCFRNGDIGDKDKLRNINIPILNGVHQTKRLLRCSCHITEVGKYIIFRSHSDRFRIHPYYKVTTNCVQVGMSDVNNSVLFHCYYLLLLLRVRI